MGRKKEPAAPPPVTPEPWDPIDQTTAPPPAPEGANPATDHEETAGEATCFMVKHRKTKEHLRHYFTPEEKSELADELAQAGVTKKALEDELITIKANFKSDITIQEEHINKLFRLIHAGYEMRTIDCQEYRDYEKKKVLTIRDDTGAIVKERPMTLDESQHLIDFEAGEGSPASIPIIELGEK